MPIVTPLGVLPNSWAFSGPDASVVMQPGVFALVTMAYSAAAFCGRGEDGDVVGDHQQPLLVLELRAVDRRRVLGDQIRRHPDAVGELGRRRRCCCRCWCSWCSSSPPACRPGRAAPCAPGPARGRSRRRPREQPPRRRRTGRPTRARDATVLALRHRARCDRRSGRGRTPRNLPRWRTPATLDGVPGAPPSPGGLRPAPEPQGPSDAARSGPTDPIRWPGRAHRRGRRAPRRRRGCLSRRRPLRWHSQPESANECQGGPSR